MDAERLEEILIKENKNIEELASLIKGDLQKRFNYFAGYWKGQADALEALAKGCKRNADDTGLGEEMRKIFKFQSKVYMEKSFNYKQALKKAINELTGYEAVEIKNLDGEK